MTSPEKKREVIGIFAAWPGLWSNLPGIGRLSFPTRKEAAERVAQGEIRTLFAQVSDIYDEIKKQPDRNPRLIFVGHSFGALVVYSALQQHFINSVVRDDIVRSYGDLVVLINPAFEGIRYDSLIQAATARRTFSKNQNPVLVTFASRSDYPVRYFFPAGRFVTTFGQQLRATSPEEYEQILQGAGYVDSFQTHTLDYEESKDNRPYAQSPEEKIIEEKYERDQRVVFAKEYQPDGELKPGWRRKYTQGAVLSHIERNPDDPLWKAPNYPFWMVSVDSKLIPGHSAIWENQAWLGFLRQLYTDIVSPPPGATKTTFSATTT